jgi:hypothetical protein
MMVIGALGELFARVLMRKLPVRCHIKLPMQTILVVPPPDPCLEQRGREAGLP